MLSSFHFFPTRDSLERKRPLDDVFRSADEIYCIHLTGRRIWSRQVAGINNVKKVILPNPQSMSFSEFARSVGEDRELGLMVCRGTRKASDTPGIKVKWYPEMIHASVNIGDPEKAQGWVHVEPQLPFTTSNLRPSFTIYRKTNQNEATIRDHWRMFQKMWEASAEPDWGYVDGQLSEGA